MACYARRRPIAEMNNTHRPTLIRGGGGDGVVWFAADEARRRIAKGASQSVAFLTEEHTVFDFSAESNGRRE